MGVILVNKLSILFFIACIFLAGCTNKDEGKTSLPPTIPSQPTVNLDTFNQPLTENVTILPQKQKIEDWTVSIISKSSKSNMPIHIFELTYEGDTKAENIVVETGNAIAKYPSIEKKQSISVGSTFSSDAKQINVVVSWKKRDNSFQQDVQFEVKS